MLFVTKDDNVFGYGFNLNGDIGLGHNRVVTKPQIIKELCFQKIKEFYFGLTIVLALNSDNDVFSWGSNSESLLARQTKEEYKSRTQTTNETKYLKPDKISYFIGKSIVQLSCGNFHSLALSADGRVYAWGRNSDGQIGCEENKDNKYIFTPIEVQFLSDHKIKSIYCSDYSSFAITTEGYAYSWGKNEYNQLGHESSSSDKNECVYLPILISLNNVRNICSLKTITYFLTEEKCMYFCGEYKISNAIKSVQFLPEMLKTDLKFNSLHPIPDQRTVRIGPSVSICAVSETEDAIYTIDGNNFVKTNYSNLFEFYSKEYQITYNTIDVDNMLDFLKKKTITDTNTIKPNNVSSGIYDYLFHEIGIIGSGGFGNVFKVKNRLDDQLYAVKKIYFDDTNQQLLKYISNEVKIMAQISGDCVVSYKNSWIESNNCLYIQMELCSDNLKNIIQLKSEAVERKLLKPMNAIEYYISCELFKELLECFKYLHESDPPIIHRDVKPANVLICYTNRNGKYLKICDFGLATTHTDSRYHTEGVGTIRYTAPEVLGDSKKRYDSKSDVYSLGIIAQELVDIDINESDIVFNCENNLLKSFQFLSEIIFSMTTCPRFRSLD